MKKFFKKTEGFTLVELIVVIAILGILAGVGVAGYAGYINKANLAADETIVTHANTIVQSGAAYAGTTAATVATTDDEAQDALVVTVSNDAAYAAMKDFAGSEATANDTAKTLTFAAFSTSRVIEGDAGNWTIDAD